MRVDVAVCGIFHYRKFIGELSRRGVLEAFYYAHRVSTTARALGMDDGAAHNLFLKEYVLHGLNRVWPAGHASGRFDSFAHDFWEWQAVRRYQPCDVFHVLMHGTARRLLAHARRQGAATIAEPVMSHPRVLQELLGEEHGRLGVTKPRYTRWMRRIEEEAHEAQFLLAGSRVVRDSFVRRGFPQERTFVLPYGVDISRFYPLTDEEKRRTSDDKFRVICVAQIIPRKGQHYLLEAWKQLDSDPARSELVLVGHLSPLMKQALSRYEGEYTHIPAVPHDVLRMAYGRSSVFVLPSVEDGFGYVTTEAMGCGLPVITTDGAGSADVVENGGNGFVVPARSSNAIAEKLAILANDETLRRAMGARSLELSRTTASWSRYVDGLLDVYKECIAS